MMVAIPSYRRLGPLIDCVRCIVRGGRQPDEIIVIGRDDDTPTEEAPVQAQDLRGGKTALRVDWVTRPGHIPSARRAPA